MECGTNQPKHRAVARRHDQLALRHEATVDIATIDTWLPDLAKINSYST